jgi:hypothetical protein
VTKLVFNAAARSNCQIPSEKKIDARRRTARAAAIRDPRFLLFGGLIASIYAHETLIKTAHQKDYGDNQNHNGD